ncbi:MAG TPA: aldehyde reductase [Thermoanaerobaculia bacterium]|nr:aldehyde reductase [Thermoanaerobaculia bacterium]
MTRESTTTDPSTTTVLVTGATGFIAQHCILQLLDAGYAVRGTARSASRGGRVAQVLEPHLADPSSIERFEVLAADLTRDQGWADAAAGCRFVLHVASPIPSAPPKDEQELIGPARDGALRVLRAAADAGVERVVMTSSLAAVLYGVERDRVFTEQDWSNVDGGSIGPYEKSKTLAERAAWELAESLDLELTTINPGLVLGPILDADLNTSSEAVAKLMNREFPACPDLHFAMVDVRDVAAAHLAAMTTAEAAGERFLCAIGDHSLREVATILDRRFGPRGYRIPTGRMPAFAMRLVALFDKTARLALNDLGRPQAIDNSKIRRVLGWEPHSLEEMVVANAESLIRHGLLRRPPKAA